MKIKKVEIQNFKCLGPNTITIDFSKNIVILVGENNVGKSSVIKAINLFFSNVKKISKESFFNLQSDIDHAITITVTFNDLTEADGAHRAVNTFSYEEDGEIIWKLKKRYFYENDEDYKCDYFAIVNGEEKINPGGRQTNVDDLFYDEKMQKVFIEGIKSVADLTKSDSKTPSAFQQIFNILIKEALEGQPQYVSLLSALEAYKNLFMGTSRMQEIINLENELSTKLSRMITSRTIITATAPGKDDLLPTPHLMTNDGREVDIEPKDQGHGLQRAAIFSLLELLAEKVSPPTTKQVGPRNLIMIEEPEIYMHPQMERKIADILYEIAESGTAQVICTTHSPIFIRSIEMPGALVRLIRNGRDLSIFQPGEIFSSSTRADNIKKLRAVIDFDPTVNELFFAKKVVLLEGYTESVVFPRAAELLGLFIRPEDRYKKRDVTLINCRSRDAIPSFQAVLNHFGISYRVIHDLEGESRNTGSNASILGLLGGYEIRRMCFNPKIEDVLGITAGGSNKWFKALEKIEELNLANQLDAKIGDYVRFVYNF